MDEVIKLKAEIFDLMIQRGKINTLIEDKIKELNTHIKTYNKQEDKDGENHDNNTKQ